ncbi:hypothetical protein PILCRDRAFT_86249 [Piloderma croceum F 1598]|uniref:J domain-containing protein n=1 Tax=Piloderma croceum (strain F 1598) TaxID=765440 RepID=A0A0C3BL97_PILCF|nr:hypothetical protein PILCRDRAFT_86249 [Piloderma croceum F 1598]
MVPPRHSNVPEAYKTLGIEEGSSLDAVKTSYKKLALSTHPDKNPGNADATAQFQKVSEAYNILVKHLDKSTRPPREHSSRGPPRGPFGWMFEEFIRGHGASRFARSRYHHFHRPEPESNEQYQERLRRRREEQVAAEERRAKEDAERKIRLEKQREQERREAEQRQKVKKANRKGEAEASRKKAECAARMQQQRGQALRSATFAAARAGDAKRVKKGVYEDNVDAAGGEVKKGCEEFVTTPPADPKDTLMHIAVKNGDADLVEWLDAHSAEPDERNSQGLTAFHVAVQLGHIEIMNRPFFENYPPKESEHSAIYSTPKSTSVLLLALDSREPEVVWMILDQGIAKLQDISNAWTLVSAGNWKATMLKKKVDGDIDGEKLDEIRQLLMTFGGFTPPPTPKVGSEDRDWDPSTNTGPLTQNGSAQTPPSQLKTKQRSPLSPEQQSTSNTQPQFNGTSSPQTKTSANGNARGRGRGRGRARARGK